MILDINTIIIVLNIYIYKSFSNIKKTEIKIFGDYAKIIMGIKIKQFSNPQILHISIWYLKLILLLQFSIIKLIIYLIYI